MSRILRHFRLNSRVLKPRGAESGELGARAGIDAGLVAVIPALPHLPDAIKAGILAMVRASESRKAPRRRSSKILGT